MNESSESQKAESHNLDLWNSVNKTDPAFTRPFSRTGGFRGTAVNATYLARRATDRFGPMGKGWGFEIADEKYQEGHIIDKLGNRQIIHVIRLELWYKLEEDGILYRVTQFGQTTFVGSNRFGVFTDEEAPKKSLTDAMTKCLSLLGFAADVHLGQFDDNKYVQSLTNEFDKKRVEEQRKNQPSITDEQTDYLSSLLKKTGTDAAKFCEFFQIDSLSDMKIAQYERATTMLKKKLNAAI